MSKAEKVIKWKAKFANYNYSQLKHEAMKIANNFIGLYPNTWQEKLAKNGKHTAIFELMKELRL